MIKSFKWFYGDRIHQHEKFDGHLLKKEFTLSLNQNPIIVTRKQIHPETAQFDSIPPIPVVGRYW